jgi:hypothetical protein
MVARGMARKIRKRSTTPPLYLFFELLLPWIVMGLVAVAGSKVGLSLELIFILSIAGALATTVLMQLLEKDRRRREARRGR